MKTGTPRPLWEHSAPDGFREHSTFPFDLSSSKIEDVFLSPDFMEQFFYSLTMNVTISLSEPTQTPYFHYRRTK